MVSQIRARFAMAEEGEWEKGGGVVRERGEGQWGEGANVRQTQSQKAQIFVRTYVRTYVKREGEGEGEEAVARQREGEDETAA